MGFTSTKHLDFRRQLQFLKLNNLEDRTELIGSDRKNGLRKITK
jgi:hypothetical protein